MATQSQLEQPLTKVPVEFLNEWIPERMDPGTIFILERTPRFGDSKNPFVAVMSCPQCGTLGLITRRQLYAGDRMICGGDYCSAEYAHDGENFIYRRSQ